MKQIVIQAVEVLSPPVGRCFAETVRQIQTFQPLRARKGTEATPAGGMPSDLTLSPGSDLVGNVWKVWKPNMEKRSPAIRRPAGLSQKSVFYSSDGLKWGKVIGKAPPVGRKALWRPKSNAKWGMKKGLSSFWTAPQIV